MGLYDRDYSHDNYRRQFGNAPQMRMTFPRLTPMVKRLLIINIAVFLSGLMIRPLGDFFYNWGSIFPATVGMALQLWRLVTYQFLHDPGNPFHIILNMLGLFFLGPTLERHWGGKRFLGFYLGCGVAGGLFYILLVAAGFLDVGPMVGASGAILGMLAACAILFPHFVVFLFFFPVPIRVASVVLTIIYVANILRGGPNADGDAAHLAGMAAGAIYVVSQSWRETFKLKMYTRTRERKSTQQFDLQDELDRILEKVHNHGIHSLTSSEKRTLKKATQAHQSKNRNS